MNSRVCSKTQRLCFCWFPAAIFVPSQEHQHSVYKQSFMILGQNFSRVSRIWNIAHTWFLARFFAFFMLFHFLDSGLSVLNGFDFYCWWRDSENRVFTRASTKCIKRNGGALKKSSEYSESFNPTFSFLKSSFLLNLGSKKENWNSCFF